MPISYKFNALGCLAKSLNLHIVWMKGWLRISSRLSSHYEAIFVLTSPRSTGMHAIVRVNESQDLAPNCFLFFSRDVLQGSGFIVHLLRPQGLTITRS